MNKKIIILFFKVISFLIFLKLRVIKSPKDTKKFRAIVLFNGFQNTLQSSY